MNWLKKFLVASALLAIAGAGLAQPTILFEPKSQSVSLGAQAVFIIMAYGPEPITYRWFKNGVALNGETGDALFFLAATLSDAGYYAVEASSASGSITSDIAVLDVDPAFRVIRSVDFVRSGGSSAGSSWVDYDQDGDLDFFICRGNLEPTQLHRNNGDGTFTRIVGTNSVTDITGTRNGSWADYNNDGFPDLYVVGISQNDYLFQSNGDGTFTRVLTSPIVSNGAQTISGAWADYDRDGFLDLMVGNLFQENALYRNNRDGTFTSITNGPIPNEGFRVTTSPAWADYDNDDDADLVIANGLLGSGNEILYRNNGNGTFTRIATGPPTQSGDNSSSASWADYDNDLDLDLFVSNTAGQNNSLYRNNGNGTFARVSTGEIVSDGGNSEGATWGDYDNDGFIDLFVVNNEGQQNFLYHNNGDGTFSRVRTGSLANEFANSSSCAWADYNNDGFLDLFVAKQGGNNSLYQNSGNSNAWIVIKTIGKSSNRGGVGAKVRVLATIGGMPRWQMREIGARGAEGSPSTPYAEFGLGDASVIHVLRVEWPSGVDHELTNVAVRQYLTVAEPPTVSIANATMNESDASTKSMKFSVTLGGPINEIVTVEYFTIDGSAVAGVDYVSTNGVLSFQPGETNQPISVEVIGDLIDESDRVFFVAITNSPIIAIAVGGGRAQGTIIDDDPLLLTIGDVTAVEGDSGITLAMLPVALQKPVDYRVFVDYFTVASSAAANVDFLHTNGTVVFDSGETQKLVVVALLGDIIDEINETLFVRLSNSVNVVLLDQQASMTIQDDDPTPVISINDLSLWEGNSGTNHAVFTVSLSHPSGSTVNFAFATSNLTAVAGSDYLARSAARSFAPGVTNTTLFTVVNGDTLLETNEVFMVNLHSIINAIADKVQGFCTILDDDFRVTPWPTGADGATIQFPSISGRSYRVEWTASLEGTPVWTILATLLGTGSPLQVVDPDARGHPQRFYRVRLL